MAWRDIGAWLLAAFDTYGYPLTFAGALLENTTLGLLFPGGTVVLLAAAYTRLGSLLWPLVWMVGWLGMMCGSSIDYWIGRKGLGPFLKRSPYRVSAERHLARARRFLERYGAAAVFLGHIMGHMRGFVALSAGSSHFPYRRYFLLEAPAALLWSLFYSAMGYVLASNVGLAERLIARLGVTVFVVLLLATVAGLLVTRGSLFDRLAGLPASGHHPQRRDQRLSQP